MIEFKKIKIKNYRSIKDSTLVFNAGVWDIVGSNNDTVFESNGSGKTTMLTALQQCLYNKTIFGSNIENCYHKLSIGYTLEVEFSKGNTDFKVVNCRLTNKLLVYKKVVNGDFTQVPTRTIPQALQLIQEIIGFDFNTFVAMTYISHSTVVNMIDNFTSSTLLKSVLDFESIYSMDKLLKIKLKESVSTSLSINTELRGVNEALHLLNSFVQSDIDKLLNDIDVLNSLIVKAPNSVYAKALVTLEQNLQEATSKKQSLQHRLEENECMCCNRKFEGLDEADISNQIYKLDRYIEENAPVLSERQEQHNKYLTSIGSSLRVLSDDYAVAKYNNKLYAENSAKRIELVQRSLELDAKLVSELGLQDVYNASINSIKSGNPLNTIIGTFCQIYNTYALEYGKLMSLEYIKVGVMPKKNSIDIVVTDKRFNNSLSITDYSGGELTRLRVVLLLALLKTVGTMTSNSTNILIFDEALDTLDASASDDLANLFSYISANDSKFIALISHGAQLSSIDFSGSITASKTDGVTTIIQEV